MTQQEKDDKKWIETELEQGSDNVGHLKPESLDFTTWELDFDKIQNVEDIKTILKAISFRFTSSHPGFDEFIHLLKKSDKGL